MGSRTTTPEASSLATISGVRSSDEDELFDAEPADGGEKIEREVYQFEEPGVAMAMYNLEESIAGFARSCFNYGLQRNYPVYLSTKNTTLCSFCFLVTVVMRIVIFPVMIYGRRHSINFANHMPTYQKLVQDFQRAQASGDHFES